MSEKDVVKSTAEVRLRRTMLFIGTGLLAVGGMLPASLAVAMARPTTPVAAVILPVVLHLLLTAAGALAWRSWRRVEHGRLEANERGIFLDARCLIERAAIRHAHVVRDERGRLVLRVVRRSMIVRSFDVALADDDDEGAALLAALRLDPARSVVQYELVAGRAKRVMGLASAALGGWFLSTLVAALVSFVLIRIPYGHHATRLLEFYAFFAVITALWAASQAHLMRSVVLSVGADGVRVRRGRKEEFHPFSTIAGATTNGIDVELRFHDGTTREYHNQRGGKLGLLSDREEEAKHLVERIESQLAAWRADTTADTTALTRNGRTARAWVDDANALRETTATFRTNAIPSDDLWRIVEDSSVPATARAGAALALRHDLDDGARARLRVAADACAAPHLRVALESVAAGTDDDQLVAALDPLDDEGATMPMRTMSK